MTTIPPGAASPPPSSELTATLVINTLDSYCGHCRQPVLSEATHHNDMSGWKPKPGGGCGARFIDMRSDCNITDEELRHVRPDLPIRIPWRQA